MFDYQAGEKYKLTLIMVAIAGVMAGVFFTVLLMPTPEAGPQKRRAPPPAWTNNPDASGQARMPDDYQGGPPPDGQQPQAQAADPMQARTLVENFLPLAWDLSAYSARANQDRALMVMTEECKQAYTANIWTPQVAQQIEQSGVQSTFTTKKIDQSPIRADGSVEVTVEGEQVLTVPGKGSKTRNVKVIYLVKQLPEGLRIAAISEAGNNTQ